MLTLEQLDLIHENAPHYQMNFLTTEYDLLYFFIVQLQKYFERNNEKFSILEPIFDAEVAISQSTTFRINDFEAGQLFFIFNEENHEISLYFYNEVHKHKFHLIEKELLSDLTIKEFFFWLRAILGISKSFEVDEKQKRTNV